MMMTFDARSNSKVLGPAELLHAWARQSCHTDVEHRRRLEASP